MNRQHPINIGGEGEHASAANLNRASPKVLQGSVARARERGPLPWLQADAASLPLRDGSIRHIYVESAPLIVGEIARVAAPCAVIRAVHPVEYAHDKHAELLAAMGPGTRVRRQQVDADGIQETVIVRRPFPERISVDGPGD